MSKIILTRGVAGCGKSTWAKEHRKNLALAGLKVGIFSRDDYRAMCFGDEQIKGGIVPDLEDAVTAMRDAGIEACIKTGGTAIVDETFIRPKYVKPLVKLANRLDVPIEIKDFSDVPLATSLKQNAGRERVVPEEVIKKMHSTLMQNREVSLEIEKELPVEHIDGLPSCVIIDVDGTLAEMNGRSPYDWTRVDQDKPREGVIMVVRSIEEARSLTGDYEAFPEEIFIFSGRSDESRAKTEAWLSAHNIPYDQLHMRKAGDNRSDVIVKREMFDTYIRGKYNVDFVMDDRPVVCRMWMEMGLPLLNVGDPYTEF